MGLCLSLASCQQPEVGERVAGASAPPGAKIELTEAWLDLRGHVVATFAVTDDDVPVGLDEVGALAPRFTLATLSDHPADGFRAWRSLLPTGAQTAANLPTGGPGTAVLTSVKQPGYELPQSFVDLGGGRYRYVFANALDGFDPSETIRVGVWLDGTEGPSAGTSSTFDFRPSGGPLEKRDTVLDASCTRCHGTVVAHEGRSGVRLCLTCHTWQNTDPDTIDPAALVTTATTKSTNPNPLELGRMLHRIHRGKDLPTVYDSTWDPAGATTVPSVQPLPLPFQPTRSGGGTPRNAPVLGRKYSIVKENGHEVVFAQPLTVVSVDPTPLGTTMVIVEGGMFPRDLRDCAVCHGDAPQGDVVTTAISRRTCSGCHADVWYQPTSPAVDQVRFPHPGGPQTDDADCLGCHVTGTPKLYAPIAEAHVPLARAPRYNKPVIEIVKVEDLAPGKQPKVTFRLWDREVGGRPIVPKPNAPEPAWEPDGPTSSYVARKLTTLSLRIIGPTTPDYANHSSLQISSGTSGGNPDPLAISTTSGADEYVYTFSSIIPPGTTGTFALGMEARRSATPKHYDTANDVFLWPYTGEAVSESAENVIVYVNTASGVWTPADGSPGAVPRRSVVEQQKCLRCHDRIAFHGTKHDVAWCVTCHTYDNTDWDRRPKQDGRVNLGVTYDGIEERSTHFKMMIHRIHTGGRKGVASLEGIAPFVIYYGKGYFFDRGGFPNDLRNCTVCHVGKSYLVDAVPADAPPTLANEHSEITHPSSSAAHPLAGEPSTPPIQAACLGCHATGATFSHVESKTVGGVETCTSCHSKGPVAVEVAHGLAPLTGGAGTTFSSIVQAIFVPRCATGCHSGNPPQNPPQLDADAAYGAIVGVNSPTAGMPYVDPGAPENSYLLYRLGDMPPGDLLDAADVAAIEAWIVNGAPND